MNDEQMQSLLDTWYRDRDAAPRNPSGGITRVMTRVPEVRQRGRWWPLPAFDHPASIPATDGPTPARGFTMFSALKFIAAAAIVALFGGFLLMGVLTTPQGDEQAPAAVTTNELLSGMVTEEVEPGVFRVINDGVRGHEYPVGAWGYTGFMVDVTPDGNVWLSSRLGEQGLFRLGEEPVFEEGDAWPLYREVAPDGSLWAIGEDSNDRGGILSFDGESWTMREVTTGNPHALAIGPDGTVWTVAKGPDKYPSAVLLRLEDDGSFTTIEDWSDVYDGDANVRQLAVSPDGDVWLVGTPRSSPRGAELLLRFDGEGWEAIPGPGLWTPGERSWYRYLDVGPDGALWVKTNVNRTSSLARFDDPGWTTFTEADGVEPWGESWGERNWPATDLLNVAADGSLWLLGSQTEEGCGGVAHYHGTTWTSYLTESCVHDLAIAPDGSLWLGANAYNTGPVGLYVITPEALAATE